MNKDIVVITGSNESYLMKIIYNSTLLAYQNNLLETMKVSDFIFDYVDQAYHNYNKTTLKRDRWYIKLQKN